MASLSIGNPEIVGLFSTVRDAFQLMSSAARTVLKALSKFTAAPQQSRSELKAWHSFPYNTRETSMEISPKASSNKITPVKTMHLHRPSTHKLSFTALDI